MPIVPAFRANFSPSDIDEILASMRAALSSGQLTLGEEGRKLEESFARMVGVPYACAVNSGTSALEIALRAFGVQGKQVLVPTNTFFASPASVVHAGGIPRFVDADPATLSLSLGSLKQRWTPECAGVIVVHIGGGVAPCIYEVQQFCKERGMFLLEDAAHAHGSTFHGQQAGSFGDAAAFSFYPTKVMTSGEGGMLVTRNKAIQDEALIYRDQGKEGFLTNFHVRMGYNWRMSELQAIVGRSQLKNLPANLDRRREIAAWYDDALKGLSFVEPITSPEGSVSNYYKYPIMLPTGVSRADVKKRMRADWQVSLAGEVYEVPCHQQPVFKPWADAAFPGAEDACTRQVCLPLFPSLSRAEADQVIQGLAATVQSVAKEASH